MIRTFLIVVSVGFVCNSAHADAPVERYVDVWPAYISPDSSRSGGDSGVGLHAAFGAHWRDNLFYEIQGFGALLETDVLGGTDYYQTGLGVDLVYAANAKQRFSPFVLFGVGFDYNDALPDSKDESGVFANAAVGFTTDDLTRHGLRVRAEARYVYDFYDDGFGDLHIGIGFSVPYGRKSEKIVERIVEVPVEVIVEKPVHVDVDADSDGILDTHDQCPNSLPMSRIDNTGCMITEQTITLQNVNFEYDSAQLTPYSEETLEGVARALRDQPNINIEIAGHTDSRGSDTYNLNLSSARAKSVTEFLVSRGIADGRMSAKGYGEAHPVGSNDSDAGRASNRRVELRIKK